MIPELQKTTEHKMQKSIEALKADLAKGAHRPRHRHPGSRDRRVLRQPVPIAQVANIT